jgi:DNA-binding transcriptional MocR family regulator
MDSFERKDQPNITLVDQVKSVINDKIARRQFVAGDKLPSIRAIAQKMGVSKSTVVDAYDGLVAQGVIRSRKGAGFYVAGHLPPLSLAHLGPQVTQDIDPLKITRQSLDAQKDYLKPGCGWLPSSWMPEEDIQKTLRSLSRSKLSNLTDYSTCSGLPVLRQLLSRKVADKGIEAGASQILLTESGTQALDLICRFLLEPNDTVLIDPCYFNFQALLKAHRVNVISTPYTINGPDLDKFKATIIAQKPRLYITNSAIHNPTGAVLSAKVAYQVLKIAETARCDHR